MGSQRADAPARAGVRIGALAGGIIFIVVGLVPAFYLGSSATLILLSYLAGGPVSPTIIMRMLIVTGSVAGVCLVAAVFMIGGATAGLALGHIAEAMGLMASPAETGEPSKIEKPGEGSRH